MPTVPTMTASVLQRRSREWALTVITCCTLAWSVAGAEEMLFKADSVTIDLKVDLIDGVALARCDHRLRLMSTIPRGQVLLRYRAPGFFAVMSDAGERLGVVVRPGNRTLIANADSQTNRERRVRIEAELCPPWKACTRLEGLRGEIQVTLASGTPTRLVIEHLSRQVGQAVAGFGLERALTVIARSPQGITIEIDRTIEPQLAALTFVAADGRTTVPRARELDGDARYVRRAYDLSTDWVGLVATWYPHIHDLVVPVHVERLEIPGGLPGIGELAVPADKAAAPGLARVHDARQPFHRAVAAGDVSAVARLIDEARQAESPMPIVATDGSRPPAAGPSPVFPPPTLIERPDLDGWRPLHRAAALGRIPVLRQLLAHGADKEGRTTGGLTALHVAVAHGQGAAVAELLAAGADRDAPAITALGATANGWTPLHHAVAAVAQECIAQLVAAGADAHRPAKDGRTPVEMAKDQNRLRALRMLLGNVD